MIKKNKKSLKEKVENTTEFGDFIRVKDVKEFIKELKEEIIKRDLHYPECWDTEKYPTLIDAVYSVIIWSEFKCQECGKDD